MACFPPHVAVLGRVRTLVVVRQQSIDVLGSIEKYVKYPTYNKVLYM